MTSSRRVHKTPEMGTGRTKVARSDLKAIDTDLTQNGNKKVTKDAYLPRGENPVTHEPQNRGLKT